MQLLRQPRYETLSDQETAVSDDSVLRPGSTNTSLERLTPQVPLVRYKSQFFNSQGSKLQDYDDSLVQQQRYSRTVFTSPQGSSRCNSYD